MNNNNKVIIDENEYITNDLKVNIPETAIDIGLGVVETARDLAWSSLAAVPAIAAKHIAVGSLKMGKALQSSSLANFTDEDMYKVGKDLEEFIVSFGGIATPKTASAQKAEELIGNIFAPISKLADWSTSSIDEDKYPNLKALAKDGAEIGIFALIPSVVRKGKHLIDGKKNGSMKPAEMKRVFDDMMMEAETKLNEPSVKNHVTTTADLIKNRVEQNQKLIDRMEIFEDAPLGKAKHKPLTAVDVNPFYLRPGELRANISPGANKHIKVGTTLAKALFSVVPETGWKMRGNIFRTPQTFFDGHPQLKPFLEAAKDIDIKIQTKQTNIANTLKHIERMFPNKKEREMVGAALHARTESGSLAMREQGIKINTDLSAQQKKLVNMTDVILRMALENVNKARVKLGHRPIKPMEGYFTFYAKESFFDNVKNAFEGGLVGEGRALNLVTQSLDEVYGRQADGVVFHHIKRLDDGKNFKLELDPLIVINRYVNEAISHVEYSPLIKMIHEATNAKLTYPGIPKAIRFADYNPKVAFELGSWSNKLAGIPNSYSQHALNKLIQKSAKNLTFATLGFNARTTLVQLTSVVPVYAQFGNRALLTGIHSYMTNKDAPINKSRALRGRIMDEGVADFATNVAGTRTQKIVNRVENASLWALKNVDYQVAEMTWRTAFHAARNTMHLNEKKAIRFADDSVTRLQGSAKSYDLSPVQRNVLGKALTLWQTFTINHINWIAKEIFGYHNHNYTKAQGLRIAMRYMLGIQFVNILFEDIIKTQSPFPSPLRVIKDGLEKGHQKSAIALKAMLEMTDLVPILGTSKYGGHPLGALASNVGDVAAHIGSNDQIKGNLIPRAIDGNKTAMLSLAEIIGKVTGMPGTTQVVKITRGVRNDKELPNIIFGGNRK